MRLTEGGRWIIGSQLLPVISTQGDVARTIGHNAAHTAVVCVQRLGFVGAAMDWFFWTTSYVAFTDGYEVYREQSTF